VIRKDIVRHDRGAKTTGEDVWVPFGWAGSWCNYCNLIWTSRVRRASKHAQFTVLLLIDRSGPRLGCYRSVDASTG